MQTVSVQRQRMLRNLLTVHAERLVLGIVCHGELPTGPRIDQECWSLSFPTVELERTIDHTRLTGWKTTPAKAFFSTPLPQICRQQPRIVA